VIARGYGIAAFHNADVDPDKNDGFKDGIHALLDQGGRAPDAWGTIAAWAWGASRCLDYFETDPWLFGKQGLGLSPEMPAIGESLHGDGAHYHIREGKHNLTVFDWTCYLDFADRVFGKAK